MGIPLLLDLYSQLAALRIAATSAMVNMDMIANNPNLARRVKHLTGCANLQVVRAWYALFNLGGMAERLRRNFYYRSRLENA